MAKIVISVERVTKSYQLGVINTGTFRDDLKKWWAKQRGGPDPFAKIGEMNHENRDGETLWALKDIDFKVEQGDTLGIIGRNGAGKSTLLKILSRVTAPTSGEIKVRGRIASLLEVGTGFHPELTGRENIYLNGAILGMTKAEINQKFDEIVDFSGVEQFIETPVKRYSSGMYVRLAFAVAAHLEPEILIVDEVLAVGDAEFQKKCLGKMDDVAQEGRTVLFVSHNMAAIQTLCKSGIFLQNGKIAFQGTQTETLSNYVNSMVKESKSIEHHNLRPGNGQIRIIDVKFKDSSGGIISVIQSGQNVQICMSYELGSNYTNGHARIGLVVSTKQGIKVFSHSSSIQSLNMRNLKNHGIVVCNIPKIPLPMLDYELSIYIKIDGAFSDIIENCIDLKVVQGDFYKTGYFPEGIVGTCLVEAEWFIQ